MSFSSPSALGRKVTTSIEAAVPPASIVISGLEYVKTYKIGYIHYISYWEVPASQVLLRCVNAHNCLGPTMGR